MNINRSPTSGKKQDLSGTIFKGLHKSQAAVNTCTSEIAFVAEFFLICIVLPLCLHTRVDFHFTYGLRSTGKYSVTNLNNNVNVTLYVRVTHI